MRSALVAIALIGLGCAAESSDDPLATASAAVRSGTAHLFVQAEAAQREIDVMTCSALHQDNIPPSSHPCVATGDLARVQLKIFDGDRLVDTINAIGPGGGCIHVRVPSLVAGYRVDVQGLVRSVDGARTSVADASTIAVE